MLGSRLEADILQAVKEVRQSYEDEFSGLPFIPVRATWEVQLVPIYDDFDFAFRVRRRNEDQTLIVGYHDRITTMFGPSSGPMWVVVNEQDQRENVPGEDVEQLVLTVEWFLDSETDDGPFVKGMNRNEVCELPVTELGMPAEVAQKLLEECDIHTIGDLIGFDPDSLVKRKIVSAESMTDIRSALLDYRVKFGMSPDERGVL